MRNHDILLPATEKAPIHTGNIASWMWYFLTPYKWVIIFSFAFRLVRYTWLSLLPIAIGFVIDALDSGAAAENPTYYATFIILYMIGYGIALYNLIFVPEANAAQKAIRGLTLYSINHLNQLSLNWHEEQGSGGKLQRVMTGRKGYDEILRHLRWDFFPLLGNVAAVIITFLMTDMPVMYLWLFTAFVSSYLFVSWFLARPYLRLYNQFNNRFEHLLSSAYEFVSAVRTVKAFHLGDYISNKAARLEKQGQEAIMDAFSTNLMRWTVSNFVGGGWIFIFAWIGFWQVIDGTISTGLYASIFFMATFIWHSCEVVGSILEKVYEYGNGMSRLITTLRVKPKQLDLTPVQHTPNDWNDITLDKISYVYNDNENQGIKGISFTVKRGEKIAFVGNSGAGKSTLVKLLMKQMLPNSGSLSIGGIDVNYIPTAKWLGQIGFVPQDVELFNLSIRNNILIDRDDIKEDVLINVLKQSALDEFINDLPDGLETIIGERGIKLSGGQRQRLGIARALVREAPIMIFDEATSSLDSISESKIQKAIENSFEGRTVFVIAHRLSTVRNVDRIIVLDNGKIIEEGNFNDLLKQDGHFAKLWAIQTEKNKPS